MEKKINKSKKADIFTARLSIKSDADMITRYVAEKEPKSFIGKSIFTNGKKVGKVKDVELVNGDIIVTCTLTDEKLKKEVVTKRVMSLGASIGAWIE